MIKLKTLVENLLEGGHAFDDVVPIEQHEVQPTLRKLETEVLSKIGIDKIGMDAIILGSAGKKPEGQTSGDIDIGIYADQVAGNNDIAITDVPQFVSEKLKRMGYDLAPVSGFSQVSFPYPIVGREDQAVQIDFMFSTNLEWTGFIYSSPNLAKGESKYKAVYRNLLYAAAISKLDRKVLKTIEDQPAEVERFVLRMDSGLFRVVKSFVGKSGSIVKNGKVLKHLDKMITATPDEFVKFLFGDQYTPKDVFTFENTYDIIFNKDSKLKSKRQEILDEFLKTVDRLNIPVPDMLT